MEETAPIAGEASQATNTTIDVAVRFLTTLFDEQDLILFRPIETWVEEGRKRSRVDYRCTYYRKAVTALLKFTALQLLKRAEEQPVNIFFGVCPRLGDKGRFDLAWQVRTVRALWADSRSGFHKMLLSSIPRRVASGVRTQPGC